MNLDSIKNIDLARIQTLSQSKELNVVLLNLVESLLLESEKQAIQIQELQDEIDRLKGEKGRSIFRPNKESDQKRRGRIKSQGIKTIRKVGKRAPSK